MVDCLSDLFELLILSSGIHLENLNTALENQFHEHILNAAGKVIEVCKPSLKGEALLLAGSVLLLNPPDLKTAGVNLVVDLSLHLLSSSQLFFLLVKSFINYLSVINFGVSYKFMLLQLHRNSLSMDFWLFTLWSSLLL